MKQRIDFKITLFLCTTFFFCIPCQPAQLHELFNQGNLFFSQGNYEAAAEHYQQALMGHENILALHYNLALTQKKRGLWKSALKHFKIFLNGQSHDINALYQYAHTLQENREPLAAIEAYKKVLAFNSEHALAHMGIGYCALMLGDFTTGWPEFFWRSPAIKQFQHYKLLNKNLHNKTIFIRAEWGFGDMVQFVRFAQVLKNQGATIVVQAYKPLVKLLKTCPFIDAVISTDQPIPPCHYEIPLMSLAATVDATIDTLVQPPYLFAPQERVEHWANQLKIIENNKPQFRIGLCWQGKGSADAPPGLQKNIPLELFEPLAHLEHVKLYSLQKINGTQQCNNISFSIHDFGPDFDNTKGRFMDTISVMQNLDLVLTIDTSIAHIAGALGVQTWVMLAHTADWRWMLDRQDSPWYPTVRLFRQEQPGDWHSVIKRIQNKIHEKIKNRELFHLY